jgi:hypothetical protein
MNVAGVALGRMRMLRNQLLRPSKRGPHPWLGPVLVVVVIVLMWSAFHAAFSAFEGSDEGAAAAADLLALVIGAGLVGLVVFDLHYAVSTLLLDSDLDLLRRAPLRAPALLAIKVVDALPRTTVLLVVLVVPAILAYSQIAPLPGWAWRLLPFQLAALWLIPLGLGLAIALVLLRRVPAARAREALGLLSTLTLTLLWLANAFLLPRVSPDPLDPTGLGALAPGHWLAQLSPAHWLAQALLAAHRGASALAWTASLKLVLGGVVAVALAIFVASRDLEPALARVAGGGAKRARAPRPHAWPAHSTFTALIARDGRLFARDWTVLSDVLTAALLWTLLPLVGAPLVNVSSTLLARSMLVALAVALGYEVAARSVPFERQAFAWVLVSPARPTVWVAAKLAGAALLSLPLLTIAAGSLALALNLGGWQWLLVLPGVLSALALSLSLGTWTGLRFADWRWSNPRAMLTIQGRLLATGWLVLQAALWIGLFAWIELQADRLPHGIAAWGPPLIVAPLTWALVRSAARRVSRLEWGV